MSQNKVIFERDEKGRYKSDTGLTKRTLSVRLRENYFAQLEAIARSRQISLAELVRSIVEDWLDQSREKKNEADKK